MKYDGDKHYELKSGRKFYAFNGILGIGPIPNSDVTYGFDGLIAETIADLTYEERQEIASEMVENWAAWASETNND